MSSLIGTQPGSLPDLGAAPELENTTWLNTPAPLRLADLRGRVVVLEMWTFDCDRCRALLPHLRDWYDRFQHEGLVVIANHYPEFKYEADLDNLRKALQEDGIRYPVAQDNDGRTWAAYKSTDWPTLYLVDKRGRLRYIHTGQGRFDEIESNIRSLLAERHP
jgi:thiol-disulfide isomerase/thioredoxin